MLSAGQWLGLRFNQFHGKKKKKKDHRIQNTNFIFCQLSITNITLSMNSY